MILVRFLLSLAGSPFNSKLRLEAENVALRHQLIILRRKLYGRVRLTNNVLWVPRTSPGVISYISESVSVQIKSNNPEAAALLVIERAANPADTRMFEFRMTRGELQQLRDDIATDLSKGRLHE